MKKSAGVIAIASNELVLKIGEKAQKAVKVIESVRYPLALGRDTFHTGSISFESLDRAIEIINGFLDICRDYGVSQVRYVATTAVRESENRDYILDQIRIRTGIAFDVIDESREKISVNKMMLSLLEKEQKESSLIVQLGSGNISIFVVKDGSVIGTQNIKIGALRISELFEDYIDKVSDYVQVVKEYLRPFNDSIDAFVTEKPVNFIISGSETDTICHMCNAKLKKNTGIIPRESFTALYKSIKNKTPEMISEEYNISEDEAETLMTAIIILSRLIKNTNAKSMVSYTYTIADSVLFEELQQDISAKLTKEYYSFAVSSAMNLAAKYQCNADHINRVSETALMIFDRMKKHHGLGYRERVLLHIAVILQDIGKIVGTKNHGDIAYHMIRNLDIAGIDEEEKEILAAVVYYHGTTIPNMSQPVYAELDASVRVLVSKLCAILKLANAVHTSHEPKFEKVSVKLSGSELIITAYTYRSIDLEKWAFNIRCRLFEAVYGIKAMLHKRSVM